MLAARVKSLIEQLWQDEDDWKEIRERFEQGSRCGAYPAILEDWSCTPDEEKDIFLKVFGIEAMRCSRLRKSNPGTSPPFDGHMDSYRNELYEGTVYLYHDELQEFAQELALVGDESPTSWLALGPSSCINFRVPEIPEVDRVCPHGQGYLHTHGSCSVIEASDIFGIIWYAIGHVTGEEALGTLLAPNRLQILGLAA